MNVGLQSYLLSEFAGRVLAFKISIAFYAILIMDISKLIKTNENRVARDAIFSIEMFRHFIQSASGIRIKRAKTILQVIFIEKKGIKKSSKKIEK